MTSLKALRAEASECTRCDLYKDATQTVFGEGPVHTPLMLMGETPGDKEDKAGHVFVGPAGELLNEALADAGIDRAGVYLFSVPSRRRPCLVPHFSSPNSAGSGSSSTAASTCSRLSTPARCFARKTAAPKNTPAFTGTSGR
jgi:uracil-DNA glycosylase